MTNYRSRNGGHSPGHVRDAFLLAIEDLSGLGEG
jgi:hypothetical protein